MGISKYRVRATHYIPSDLADCSYILTYLLLNRVQNYPGFQGDFGHLNIYLFFQSDAAARIQNNIDCDLSWDYSYKFFTQTSPLIVKPYYQFQKVWSSAANVADL